MTSRTVAVICYVVAVICIVVGLLDVLNVYDINEGTGWGLIIGGAIIGVVGAVVDPRRSHRL